MDEWAAANAHIPVEIQIGKGDFEPRHARWVRKLALPEYQARVANCALFVAHCGMGSIISAIEAGKPILMLPRLQSQGEHNTDHQLATAKHVGIRPGLHVAADVVDLKARASALLADKGQVPAPISRFADPEFTARIRAFIES
jgi:UDP-N-acetylglucosamine transferase subunit ALG13